MTLAIIASLSISLAHIPALILRYLPFSSLLSQKQSRRIWHLYGVTFLVLSVSCYFYLSNASISITPALYKQWVLFASLPYLVINILCIPHQLYKHLFVFGMQAGYTFFLHTPVAILQKLLPETLPIEVRLLFQTLAYTALFALITRILWKYIHNSLLFHHHANQDYYWNIIWLIPTLAFYGNAILTLNEGWIGSGAQIISRILMALAIYISWRCVMLDFQSLENMHNLQNSYALLSMQKDAIQNQTDILLEKDNQIRILSHDMRHHISLIKTLIQHNKKEDALAHLTAMDSTFLSMKPIEYSKNSYINSALLVSLAKAKEHGIVVQITTDLPAQIPWNSHDIAILLANVLENAIHASAQQDPSHREIRVTTRLSCNTLAISVQNRYNGTIRLGRNGFPATLEASHGTGMKSILTIVDKHQAHASCSHQEGWFTMQFLFTTTNP